jgi:LysR family cyn operon transcriptional activator
MQEPFEIRQLRYFLQVAEAGSFSRAARRLGVSQPAISQQMRILESSLHAVLFQRRGRRILLTSTGLLFEEQARTILRQIDHSLQELSKEPEEQHGTIHVGVIPYLNAAVMPALLGRFAETHPGIDLSVEEISSTEIETALEEGRMDVGLGWLTRHSPNLRYESLCHDRFTLVVSESHPWSRREVVNLSELHRQRLLQLPDTYVMRRMTDEMCRKHQVRPYTVAEINSIETLLRSLEPLRAAALMPKISLRGAEGLQLKAIRLMGKNLDLDIGLLRLIGSRANSTVGAFVEVARTMIPEIVADTKRRTRSRR